MDEFFRLLKDYNKSIEENGFDLPEWCDIYQQENPPAYWIQTGLALKRLPKDYFCVEIGSGFGDIIALLLHLGFKKVVGFEKNPILASLAAKKIATLFGKSDCIINTEYPYVLNQRPNILILVNCVFSEDIYDQKQYLDRLLQWQRFNGVPEIYIFEVIDSSFTNPHPNFPEIVRVKKETIENTFSDFNVTSDLTYIYPKNKSTKRLFVISQKEKTVES